VIVEQEPGARKKYKNEEEVDTRAIATYRETHDDCSSKTKHYVSPSHKELDHYKEKKSPAAIIPQSAAILREIERLFHTLSIKTTIVSAVDAVLLPFERRIKHRFCHSIAVLLAMQKPSPSH